MNATASPVSPAFLVGAPDWVRLPPSLGPKRVWPPVSTPEELWVAKHAVRIGPSSIRGAGLGVFASIDIPSLRVLSRYHGTIISNDEYDILYDSSAPYCPDYVLGIGKGKKAKTLDSPDPHNRHWTVLVNDPRGTELSSNLAFTNHGGLRTTQRIFAGDELLIDYGDNYDWDCKKRKKSAAFLKVAGDLRRKFPSSRKRV